MRFLKTPLHSNFSLEVTGTLYLSQKVKDSLEELWEKETQKNSFLFDGEIYCFGHYADSTLFCTLSNYKYWYGQRKMTLADKGQCIKPLAVTGITSSRDRILLGRRSHQVTQDKGLYDLLPSGGLSKESGGDYKKQLCNEFVEELKSDTTCIDKISPLFLLEDLTDQVVDIVSNIKINGQLDQFDHSSDEYTELIELRLNSLALDHIKSDMSPASHFILKEIIREVDR